MKRYVLGDCHGNYKALVQVLKESKFNYDKDLLIIIGDVVDGYNCSYEVVEELLKVKNRVFIIGNHDVWWMNHMRNGWADYVWLSQGGKNTRESYLNAGYNYKKIPAEHKKFFGSGKYYYELDGMMFVHGGFSYPHHPETDDIETLTWDRKLIERCKMGLRIKEWDKIFIGHTSTESQGAEPVIYQQKGFGKFIQIDCGAGWKGRLCLYNIDTDKYFFSDYAKGHDGS
ncbi:hypothetical protein LCGC14_0622690 [marine sediment metagenome]|uniref:Calcineurin-like phosphoesterase domain-containing protein n=1 Tax=marine sediment metagenome TaxID=412755 RepID=A0A0F9UCX1_9ZZZZ